MLVESVLWRLEVSGPLGSRADRPELAVRLPHTVPRMDPDGPLDDAAGDRLGGLYEVRHEIARAERDRKLAALSFLSRVQRYVASKIEDYGLIGNGQTAALAGRDGSIDWLCLPRFDSPSCFAALLGRPEHGRWIIAPRDPVNATRRQYREDTLVLETEFETTTGTCVSSTSCRRGRMDTTPSEMN